MRAQLPRSRSQWTRAFIGRLPRAAEGVTPEHDRTDLNRDIGALAHRAWSDADAPIDELRALEQP
jgi:hypothetical protein